MSQLPLKDRKYLSLKEMCQYTGLGVDKIRQIINDGVFTKFFTVGKQNKLMIDRVAFEEWIETIDHID